MDYFFKLPNFSTRNMTLWSTHPLTWVPGIILGRKGRPARKANNLTAICEPTVWRKSGSLYVSQPYGPPRPVTEIHFPLFVSAFLKISSSWPHPVSVPSVAVLSSIAFKALSIEYHTKWLAPSAGFGQFVQIQRVCLTFKRSLHQPPGEAAHTVASIKRKLSWWEYTMCPHPATIYPDTMRQST
jgi:hypothetical protein